VNGESFIIEARMIFKTKKSTIYLNGFKFLQRLNKIKVRSHCRYVIAKTHATATVNEITFGPWPVQPQTGTVLLIVPLAKESRQV
jgi:hypothetical protein